MAYTVHLSIRGPPIFLYQGATDLNIFVVEIEEYRCLMGLPCVHLTMLNGFDSAQDVLSPWGPRPSSDVSMGLPCHITLTMMSWVSYHRVMGFAFLCLGLYMLTVVHHFVEMGCSVGLVVVGAQVS